MDISPRDRVLEIGCGSGVAVSLVCARLSSGQVVALDRSVTAIKRAAERNAEHVASGKASFQQVDLAKFAPGRTRFDIIFATNVNVFWVRMANVELRLVKKLLRPAGTLYLFHEAPGPHRAGRVARAVAEQLTSQGFSTEITIGPVPSLVCVAARQRAA